MEQKEIIKTVNKITGLDITKPTRKREVVEARALYYKISKTFNKRITLEELGNTVNKNHATVIHSLKHYDYFERYNPTLANHFKSICKILGKEVEPVNDLNYKEVIERLKLKLYLLEEENAELKYYIKKQEKNNDIEIINKIQQLLLNSTEEQQEVIIERLTALYKMNNNNKF